MGCLGQADTQPQLDMKGITRCFAHMGWHVNGQGICFPVHWLAVSYRDSIEKKQEFVMPEGIFEHAI